MNRETHNADVYLNRKHEMFLNYQTQHSVLKADGLTVNMKCF